MNVVLFGPPGAGKGTQSSFLVDRLGMYQISTGDLFRAAIKNGTELGKKAQLFMEKGQLVPDSIVIGMVEEVLEKSGRNKPFILDGFPRTVAQAEALRTMLGEKGLSIGKAIFLEVPREELISRLTGRRTCQNCGAVFHVDANPPRSEGVCDNCGGSLIQRKDDHQDVIATRLKAYDENTFPLRNYYRELKQYVEVDGNRELETVFKDIKNLLN